MDITETAVGARDLHNVRISATLSKRSSSFLAGWAQRFVAIDANFLYVYASNSVSGRGRIDLIL